MGKFENKNVVITGSSEGVGQTIACEFAKEGANLFLANRRVPERTMEMIRPFGKEASYAICDIGKERDVVEMAKKAAETFDGKIDILVNNAGFNGKAHLVKDMPLSDWEYTIKVNLTGTMMVTREIVPYMISRKSGVIMNMSSNTGRRGIPYRADYACTKWALIGLTQTLALELAEHNIRVNAVCPGPIEGERAEQLVRMHAEAEHRSLDEMHRSWEDVPMKRFVKPEEVADVVKFLCGSESSSLTGQAINVSCGLIMT
ncbi:putative 3-oxoacyl-[acyl-carrier-protein] reductase FabG [Ruminococcaceae bacterium BL-6]|nr:putative 3-oxoacyl-[acyl-carrier-protein] reductase FabG [Ruminococcaceae bacterium BL-6]